MALVADTVSNDITRFFAGLYYGLFSAFTETAKQMGSTHNLNKQLKLQRDMLRHMESIFNIDKTNQTLTFKDGRSADNFEYNICTCKSFARKRLETNLQKLGIDALFVENIVDVPTIFIPKAQAIEFANFVRDFQYQQAQTTEMSVSKFNQTFSERARYLNINASEFDAFENYVKSLGARAFPYAVHNNENGTVEIYVPRHIATDKDGIYDLNTKMKEFKLLYSNGLKAIKDNIVAQRKFKLLDDAKDALMSHKPQREIFADVKHPGNYIMIENGSATFFSNYKQVKHVQGLSDVNSIMNQINNFAQSVKFEKIPQEQHEDFTVKHHIKKQVDFSREALLPSEFFINKTLLEHIEDTLEKHGVTTDVKSLIVQEMKDRLSKSDSVEAQQLFAFINNNDINSVSISQLLETGSSYDAGITTDPQIASMFDKEFAQSLSNLTGHIIVSEQNAMSYLYGNDDNLSTIEINNELVERYYRNKDSGITLFDGITKIMISDLLESTKSQISDPDLEVVYDRTSSDGRSDIDDILGDDDRGDDDRDNHDRDDDDKDNHDKGDDDKGH